MNEFNKQEEPNDDGLLYFLLSKLNIEDHKILRLLVSNKRKNKSSLSTVERIVLKNLTAFEKKTVEDIMTPRADMVAIPNSYTIEKASTIVLKSPHTRYPVTGIDNDDIKGFVHVKDLYGAITKKENGKVGSHKRDILVVSSSMSIIDLWQKMLIEKSQMAMIPDGEGGVLGIVTQKDIVEKLMGDLEDEHELPDPDVKQLSKYQYQASARIELEALEAKIGKFLSAEEHQADADTLSGLIFTMLGRTPQRGETITHTASGIEFYITDVSPKRIKSVKIVLPRTKTVSNKRKT